MPIDKSLLVTKEDKEKAEHETELRNASYAGLSYLRETDWYVVRAMETGKLAPEDVVTKRAEAREAIDRAEYLTRSETEV